MNRVLISVTLLALLPLATACSDDASASPTKTVAQTQIERGKYLVGFGACHDCHTPLKMGANGPEPDMSRALSGHPSNLVLPEPPKSNGPWVISAAGTNTAFAGPWGISYTRNLTPDKVSGLGIWTEDMFIKTMRTGRHMGVSRPILPPMPWQSLNSLNDEDLKAVFAYLQSVKPIYNEVPDPVIAPPPTAKSHS